MMHFYASLVLQCLLFSLLLSSANNYPTENLAPIIIEEAIFDFPCNFPYGFLSI